MSFKRVLAFTLLAALMPLSSAQAEVKWPYMLDTDFSGYGLATELATTAQALAMDGEDTVVAITTTVTGSDEIDIELLRYSANGQLKPWTGVEGSPTHLPLIPMSNTAAFLVLRDLKIDRHGDIHVLLDVRPGSSTMPDTQIRSVKRDGSYRGAMQVDSAPGIEVGHQLLLRGDRMFALTSGDGPWIRLTAISITGTSAPLRDYTWGTNSSVSFYSPMLCGTPALPASCTLNARQLSVAPGPLIVLPPATGLQDSTGFYIGGSIHLTRNTPASQDLFLLRLDKDGNRVTSFGNNGWHTWGTDFDDRMAGLKVLRTGLLLTGAHDVLALNSIDRPCGEGIIVNRRKSSDGSHISRTFTHGGSASATSCDSIQATDMVLTADNRIAVVGRYLTNATPPAPQGHAAMLITFNPDVLSDSQSVQMILGGEVGPYQPEYGFTAALSHTGTGRLMAVGTGTNYFPIPGSGVGESDFASIAALKEKPLFADGFED